jgi:8-oxo-dGTP pyrophosphatase MutT (NUDIX family)
VASYHSAPLRSRADIGDLALTSPHLVRHPMLSALDAPTVRCVADEHGAWRTFGEKTIYESSPWVRLGLVDVEAPNGERWDYHVVHFGRIAIAMIVDEDADTVLMLHRYRFPTDQWGYELLGGLVEDGEDPAATAAREAVEESGWSPVGPPEELIGFEPLPGNATAHMSVYLWRQAERVGEPTDTEEVGRVEWVPLDRVPELARRGELLGSGALVPLLYYVATRAPRPTSVTPADPAAVRDDRGAEAGGPS